MSEPAARLGDRYEVGDLLGRGGMADVHRALDTSLDRSVAVKLLRDVSDVETQRFADEARLLSTLHHPNIVTLLDAGVADDRPWIALELVEGSTLAEVMASGPMDPEQVQVLGAGLAAALAHAHACGIVHRDVKPSNVLVTADGSVKLTDFGIARMADATSGLTVTGHTVGTAAYLSPEQVQGESVTGAGDVYSLGLLLLEALSGVRAYPGPPVEAALARLHRAPLIPTSLPPGWPGLLAAMTASDAGDRPSIDEVALCLGSGGSPALPLREQTATSLVSMISPRRRPRRRLRLVAMAAAVAVVATLVLARGLVGDPPTEAGASQPASPSPSAATRKPVEVVDTQVAVPTSVRSPTPTPTRRVSTDRGASRATSSGRPSTATKTKPAKQKKAAPAKAKPKPKQPTVKKSKAKPKKPKQPKQPKMKNPTAKHDKGAKKSKKPSK